MLRGLLISILLILIPVTATAEQQTIVAKDGAEMALVPAGKFIMGCSDDDTKDITPWHEVHVDSFYIDIHEVTNEKFVNFLNDINMNEEEFGTRWNWIVTRDDIEKEERYTWWPTEIYFERGKYVVVSDYGDHPVITVSWYAADSYCRWAGKRLPTEAEWEKAARGDLNKKRYPWGDDIPPADVVYNRSWRDSILPAPTGKVGNFYPNGYGLYDMAGNVWEWTSDWFDPLYYKHSPKINPQGPPIGEEKVLRGGAWHNDAEGIRVGIRNTEYPTNTGDGVGFRCVMDADKFSADNTTTDGDDKGDE